MSYMRHKYAMATVHGNARDANSKSLDDQEKTVPLAKSSVLSVLTATPTQNITNMPVTSQTF